MNFFFDNCTSPVLAETIDGFIRHRDGHAWHIRDCASAGLALSRHATDTDWMAALGADPRDWVVVTGDRRIGAVPAEKEAFRRAALKGFVLAPGYQKMRLNEQASTLLWRWPELVDVISRFRPPILVDVPPTRGAKLGTAQW